MIDHIGQFGAPALSHDHAPRDRSPVPADPDRRQVAVLFADICGFTRLVETVEPEAVYRIVRPLLDELVDCVHRHGGEIQQVLGDGFMAVFGLRRSRGGSRLDSLGDETARATAAGYEMLRATRPGSPEVHIGVESGEVLVTSSWDPASFGVWGRAVNLAQRMCGVAGPGELVLGPRAYAIAGHLAAPATEALVRVRGVAEAVPAHRITLEPALPMAA
ncbi:adenylate/guanylate cyclase domain-containing protein [Actinoplanes sp. CA-030573]|uniref:adenylate/guanylate cyclase domain-containing protein n=1 Tax=Actinoplanes sp. CA-030573 TaxID=3239898 RepID=UPI003D910FA4